MTQDSPSPRLLPPKWLTVLGWFYLMLFGFELIANLSQGSLAYNPLFVTVGFGSRTPDPVVTWWAYVHIAVELSFAIGCLAVLLRDRDLVWFAIVAGWGIAVLQCCDSFIGIFHLRFTIPVSAPVYAAFAWRASSLLRTNRPAPPGSLGTA